MPGRLVSLALCAIVCLLAVSGCAETSKRVGEFVSSPFKKTPEELLGIKSPEDRVKELRTLAKAASDQLPSEQEMHVARLSDDYRHESDPWVRREILRTLSAYPQPAAGEVLVSALSDDDIETRRVACYGLGARGDQTAVQELARVLASETNTDVRLAAVRALGKTGSNAALSPLSEALVDADPAMQAEAQQSLVAVSGHDYGNDAKAWRELAQTGSTSAPEVSFAEKLRRAFY